MHAGQDQQFQHEVRQADNHASNAQVSRTNQPDRARPHEGPVAEKCRNVDRERGRTELRQNQCPGGCGVQRGGLVS